MKHNHYFKIVILTILIVTSLSAKIVDITVLHTTDLHGNFLPVIDYEGNENVGGIIQLSNILHQQQKKYPDAILVDNGDSYQGSMTSHLKQGSPVIDWMNSEHYSIWNLGNHEFDWGTKILAKNIKDFSGTVLCANCHWDGNNSSPLSSVKPYVIRKIKGVKIAFVGITHPNIPFWSRQKLIKNIVVEQPLSALLRVMPKVRAEKPDIIILLSHAGLDPESNELEVPLQEVIDMFSDIDVVIGGHTHVMIPSMTFNKVLFTQAGYHGINLGELHLIYDTESKSLLKKQAKLIPIEPEEKFRVNIIPSIKNIINDAAVYKTQIITKIVGRLGGLNENLEESDEQTLISEAIADASGVEIVFHGAFSCPQVISNEDITVGMIYRIVPYENFIVTAKLTANEIKSILDAIIDEWGESSFLFPYGLKAKIDPEGLPGERIISLRNYKGKPLETGKRYKVAFNSYVAASGGTRFNKLRSVLERKSSDTIDTDISTREAVINFLKKKKSYKTHTIKWIDQLKQEPGAFAFVTVNTPLRPGAVRLVEFAYMLPGNRDEEQAGEWFVVKNESAKNINLKGYTFSDGDEGGTFRINKDVPLAPDENLVFCHTAEIFRKHPYAQNPYLRLFEYGELAGRLNLGNRGDELMIIDPQGRLADEVVYGPSKKNWPNWPASSKTPNHKIGESLMKTQGGWIVNEVPLSEW